MAQTFDEFSAVISAAVHSDEDAPMLRNIELWTETQEPDGASPANDPVDVRGMAVVAHGQRETNEKSKDTFIEVTAIITYGSGDGQTTSIDPLGKLRIGGTGAIYRIKSAVLNHGTWAVKAVTREVEERSADGLYIQRGR